jgi:hypothetical protein
MGNENRWQGSKRAGAGLSAEETRANSMFSPKNYALQSSMLVVGQPKAALISNSCPEDGIVLEDRGQATFCRSSSPIALVKELYSGGLDGELMQQVLSRSRRSNALGANNTRRAPVTAC